MPSARSQGPKHGMQTSAALAPARAHPPSLALSARGELIPPVWVQEGTIRVQKETIRVQKETIRVQKKTIGGKKNILNSFFSDPKWFLEEWRISGSISKLLGSPLKKTVF